MHQARIIGKNLVKEYKDAAQTTQVLSHVDFTLMEAEKVAIIGSSGSGKSTLLHILSGLEMPTSGQVSIMGKALDTLSAVQLAHLRNRQLGMIYQFHHLLPEFTARENVAMPLMIAGQSWRSSFSRADEMLAKVGLSHRLSHYPAMMSGGEKQRVAIARALIHQPSIVFADEPTGNLDQRNGEQIYQIFQEVTSELRTSVVLVTHDQHLAEQMDRVLVLRDGRLENHSLMGCAQ